MVDQVGPLAGLARALLAERNIAAVIQYRPVRTGRRRAGLTLACRKCVIW